MVYIPKNSSKKTVKKKLKSHINNSGSASKFATNISVLWNFIILFMHRIYGYFILYFITFILLFSITEYIRFFIIIFLTIWKIEIFSILHFKMLRQINSSYHKYSNY